MYKMVLYRENEMGNHRQALDKAMFELNLDVPRKVLTKFQELNDNKDFSDDVGGITEDYTYRVICKYEFMCITPLIQ